MRSLHILEVVHAFPPASMSGTELYTFHLATALQRLGHRVTVLYPQDSADAVQPTIKYGCYEGINFIQLHRTPPPNWVSDFFAPGLDAAFAEILRSYGFDFVHFQHLIGLSVTWLQVAHDLGVPSALKIDDMFFYCARNHLLKPGAMYCHAGPESLDKCVECHFETAIESLDPKRAGNLFGNMAFYRSLMRRVITFPDFVHFASEFVARDFEKLGLKPRRGQVIHTGIAPFLLAPRSAPGPRLRIGYMGAIHDRKGIQYYLSAALRFLASRQIRNADSELEFLIYGLPTPQEALFEQLQRAVETTPHLDYRGGFGPADRATILAELDLLVVPSSGENYPFILREALYAGVPVLATRVAGIPEIVRAGENGWLFEPNDVDSLLEHFERIARDPRSLSRLRPDGDSIKRNDQEAHELIEIFRELVQVNHQARGGDPVSLAMQRARDLIEQGSYWEALCALGQDRARIGDHPQLLLGLGVASFHLGNPDRAFELLRDAHALSPLDADIAVSLALAAEKIGRLPELASVLEPVARAFPDDSELARLRDLALRASR